MGDTIIFEIDEGVAHLTLNRPDRLNAFNTRMHEEIAAALDVVESDEGVRALLLTGSGRGFCAGQDLTDRKPDPSGAPIDGGAALERYYNPLVRRLRKLPKPVIAAVNGVAAGAGANVALAADIVIAARSARFIQAFARIGLSIDAGGSHTLPRLVGRARALGLAMLGEALSAEDAASWGLIWRVVDDADLMPQALVLARRLAEQPTVALGLIKQAIEASATNGLDAQLDLERDLQRKAARTEDFREGVMAFLEKRPANFRGR